MPYLTPDESLDPNARLIIQFEIEKNEGLLALLKGGAVDPSFFSNLKQHGTMSREDTAQKLTRCLLSWREAVDMLGTIVPVITKNMPNGILLCDGSTYAKSDYPRLWEVIADELKTATHFTVPDLRNRFIFGVGEHSDFTLSGEATHTLTTDEMPSHTHETLPHSHATTIAVPSTVIPGELPIPLPSAIPSPATTAPSGVTVLSSGAGQAHNNMPPFIALRYGVVAI